MVSGTAEQYADWVAKDIERRYNSLDRKMKWLWYSSDFICEPDDRVLHIVELDGFIHGNRAPWDIFLSDWWQNERGYWEKCVQREKWTEPYPRVGLDREEP